MNPKRASMPSFTLPYDFSGELDRLERVPIAVWSSKPFVGRWWAESQPPIEADLRDEGNLTGTLTCHFDVPLADCVLIYDTWAYPLRTLEPGQRIDIDENRFDPQHRRDVPAARDGARAIATSSRPTSPIRSTFPELSKS